MRYATPSDYELIQSMFRYSRKVFPHIRPAYIWRKINKKQVIFQEGVVIFFHFTKRKQKMGSVFIEKGNTVINQIISHGSVGSAVRVINEFFDMSEGEVYLSVRKDNDVANKFYRKIGMLPIGKISWSNNTIPGLVWVKRKI